MRPSSVRAVPLVLAGLLLVPALATAPGCGGQAEQPAPKKLDRQNPFDRGAPRPEQDPNDPLRDPETEVPRGRAGEQVSDAEIDAALAEAAEHAKVGNVASQRIALRKCANKTPASARCDGQLGLTMADAKNWRATAQYYLSEAAKVDDPKADAALYQAVGEALVRLGRIEDAISAMDKAAARDDSAETLFAVGRVLSLAPDRLAEAADRISQARGKDDRLEWVYEEAVLRGQIPVREQAQRSLELFETYISRAESVPAESLPAPVSGLAGRMAELEQLRKSYPTQAEYDASRAAAPEGAAPAPSDAPPPAEQPS